MSWATFEQTRRVHPEIRPLAEKVLAGLKPYADDEPVNPALLQRQAGVTNVELLAILNVLRENDLGDFGVAIADPYGRYIRPLFKTVTDVPDEFEDDHGNTIHPESSDIRIVFLPKLRYEVGSNPR